MLVILNNLEDILIGIVVNVSKFLSWHTWLYCSLCSILGEQQMQLNQIAVPTTFESTQGNILGGIYIVQGLLPK